MEFDKIHFQLNKLLEPKQKFKKSWTMPPDTLFFTTSLENDKIPLNSYFKWKNMDVLMWIEKLGFPQYRVSYYLIL